MKDIFLDFRFFSNPREVHRFLKEQMKFPDYYGMNLDALYDCLTDRSEETVLHYRTTGNPYERGFVSVFNDAAAGEKYFHAIEDFGTQEK